MDMHSVICDTGTEILYLRLVLHPSIGFSI